ncbi:ABC transporter ATP-binding protein [Actinoallomurus iriomotensis]|uniref:Dipeptide/oligopeptide/nickel ABC transporter ATP-binding protein n=1 Tax=Actinoallomurus iriomotensis TaxID=478107 RepID=A0A9W6RUW1_9ACTN|nr:oligopeptide/dipeptide ABC transporter ATP-binding protein [Actinoallomurus iriomotensis]GLY82143.1 dipeptide/oligopeptide/nickel ABC transporter ATP-binding protein [Actinoallomurus iriomotensis]
MNAPDHATLECRELTKIYPAAGGLHRSKNKVRAVANLDLSVRNGETVGLVGESGCGKSTLARLITGMEQPTSGSVLYRGGDVHQLRGKAWTALRRSIQMVLQDSLAALNPRMPVEALVGEPLLIHEPRLSRAERRTAVIGALDAVGIPARMLKRRAHELSGGQRQRIGIARALILDPEVIIWDEPVSALDLSVQAQVLNLIADLQRTRQRSYLFISHDLDVVRHVADRVIVMYLGQVVESGRAEDVYTNPGHPYTAALLSATPQVDRASGRERIVLRGELPTTLPATESRGCPFRSRCWKAAPVCETTPPPLVERPNGPGHLTACHFPMQTSV